MKKFLPYLIHPSYIYHDLYSWWYLKYRNPFNIRPYGVCPVQAEGTLFYQGQLDCFSYYFRARGTNWHLDIMKNNIVIWKYRTKDYCAWPEAGWISPSEAVRLATFAIQKYERSRTSILL